MDTDTTHPEESTQEHIARHRPPGFAMPWQIWPVISLLGLEGLGNLLSIPDHPISAWWLACKCVFITGLMKGWNIVYAITLAVAAIHIVYFLGAPIVAMMNFILVVLLASAFRSYFPKRY